MTPPRERAGRATWRREVHDGLVCPPLTTADMRSLLSSLPLERSEVRKVTLWAVTNGSIQISVSLDRVGDSTYSWGSSTRPDIRSKIEQRLRIRDFVEAYPLYQALSQAHGSSNVSGYSDRDSAWAGVSFGGSDAAGGGRYLKARFSMRQGSIVEVFLHGSLGMCRVAGLEPVVGAVVERLGLSESDLDSTLASITIAKEGQVRLDIFKSATRSGASFVGKLGTPAIEPYGPS